MRIGKGLVVSLAVLVMLGALASAEESTHSTGFTIGASAVEDGETISLVQELLWAGATDYNNLVDPAYKGVAMSSPSQAVWTVLTNRDLALQITATVPVGLSKGKKMKAQFYVAFYPDAADADDVYVIDDWSTLKNQTFTSTQVDLAGYDVGETGCKIVLEAGVQRKGMADKADTYQMTLTLTVSAGGL